MVRSREQGKKNREKIWWKVSFWRRMRKEEYKGTFGRDLLMILEHKPGEKVISIGGREWCCHKDTQVNLMPEHEYMSVAVAVVIVRSWCTLMRSTYVRLVYTTINEEGATRKRDINLGQVGSPGVDLVDSYMDPHRIHVCTSVCSCSNFSLYMFAPESTYIWTLRCTFLHLNMLLKCV